MHNPMMGSLLHIQKRYSPVGDPIFPNHASVLTYTTEKKNLLPLTVGREATEMRTGKCHSKKGRMTDDCNMKS